MTDKLQSPALDPSTLPTKQGSRYPAPFREVVLARSKQIIGDALGLKAFGVNLVRLPPGAWSSQRHWHTHEDEFVYVVEGQVTLVTNAGEQVLGPGMVAGFPAGSQDGHHLINRSDKDAVFLEVGNRVDADECVYNDIDMELRLRNGEGVFVHKNGEPYET